MAGIYGGRRLVTPKGQATRPTGDRVKEALFAILGPLSPAHVLDLYAGSGALGLEALSRGAVHIVFVEEARAALASLRENIAQLGAESAVTVVPRAVERSLTSLGGEPFSLVLADPPYADVTSGKAVRALGAVVASGQVAAGGTVVLEHASSDPSPVLPGLGAPDSRRYGETTLAFYEHP